MNARSMTLAVVRAGALALLATCGGSNSRIEEFTSPPNVTPNASPTAAPCSPSAQPMGVPHIGPDATIRVLCGASGSAAVASVDERGPGTTSWSASVRGAPAGAFSVPISSFDTCQALGPSIATVVFQPPADARPGDAFEAVATIHAEDGAFADGTVNVHAEVVVPAVTVDKTTLDFGDLLAGATGTQLLTFVAPANVGRTVQPSTLLDQPFSFAPIPQPQTQGNVSVWFINFNSSVPGDFSASLGFATFLLGKPACEWTTTITLHAHVLGDGVVADGGAGGDAR